MEKIAKNVVSIACLFFLIGCADSKKEKDDPSVSSSEVINEELRAAAADFVATAGDRAYFNFDSSVISKESEACLLKQVDWLNKNKSNRVLVEGHCDERGTREYNIGLGERRADAVAKFLISHGISEDRVRTVSYGKDRPIAAEGTQEEVYKMNRVAISVVE
jgi:peptidoglycan-associated lipoprotein